MYAMLIINTCDLLDQRVFKSFVLGISRTYPQAHGVCYELTDHE